MLNFSKVVFILVIICAYSISNTSHANENISSRQALETALSEHKGKVIYLDFWASWCKPCVRSFPWMNDIQKKYQAQGFTVISVNLDSNKALASQFLKTNPATFAVIYDPKGKVAKHFKIKGMPSSMLIGRDGKIKYQHTGFFNKKIPQYIQEIETLLGDG